MKALVKAHAKKGIWMQDMPEPTVGINDVKIKIKKTAICGTDLHIYKWDEWSERTIKTPMIIGHEYVGIISEIGDGVKHFEVGDRVTGEGHIACGIAVTAAVASCMCVKTPSAWASTAMARLPNIW